MNVYITADIDQFLVVTCITDSSGKGCNISYFYYKFCNFNIICRELFNMVWIEELNLTRIIKYELPKNIINLINIKILVVHWCELTDISLLSNLKKLIKLRIYQNAPINFNTAKGMTIKECRGYATDIIGLEKVLGRKLW